MYRRTTFSVRIVLRVQLPAFFIMIVLLTVTDSFLGQLRLSPRDRHLDAVRSIHFLELSGAPGYVRPSAGCLFWGTWSREFRPVLIVCFFCSFHDDF